VGSLGALLHAASSALDAGRPPDPDAAYVCINLLAAPEGSTSAM
jgi:hypothetical protein